MFARFEKIRDEMLTRSSVVLIPKVLCGASNGQLYPESYTEIEKFKFRSFSEDAKKEIETNAYRPYRNKPTIDVLTDADVLLQGTPDYTGITCSAGRKFVKIDYDGTIFRCGSNTVIGDVSKNELNLFEVDKPCDDITCHYFCDKYSALPSARRYPTKLLQITT
jgi:hypothetical protein